MGQIKLFIMSFWIFFLLLLIVTIDYPWCIRGECSFIGFSGLFEYFSIRNGIAFACIFFLLLGLNFYYKFKKSLEGDLDLPVRIKTIESIDYEYFSLLVTIISLVAFDFTSIRGLFLLIVLLIILAAIFIKTELFYSNPSFALLNFHIYKTGNDQDYLQNKILITKDKLETGCKVNYLRVSDKVYFTKRAR